MLSDQYKVIDKDYNDIVASLDTWILALAGSVVEAPISADLDTSQLCNAVSNVGYLSWLSMLRSVATLELSMYAKFTVSHDAIKKVQEEADGIQELMGLLAKVNSEDFHSNPVSCRRACKLLGDLVDFAGSARDHSKEPLIRSAASAVKLLSTCVRSFLKCLKNVDRAKEIPKDGNERIIHENACQALSTVEAIDKTGRLRELQAVCLAHATKRTETNKVMFQNQVTITSERYETVAAIKSA